MNPQIEKNNMDTEPFSLIKVIGYIICVYILLSRIVLMILLNELDSDLSQHILISEMAIPIMGIAFSFLILNIITIFLLLIFFRFYIYKVDEHKGQKYVKFVGILLIVQPLLYTILGILLFVYDREKIKTSDRRIED